MAINFLNTVAVDENVLFVDAVNDLVGIGTDSPVYQLTLGGNAVGSTQGLRINDPSNAAYGAHFSFSDTPNEVWIGGITNNTYNSAIGIHREATRSVTIDVDSNVGIGTDNPDVRLEVVEASPTNGIVADFVNSTNAGGTTAAIKLSNADSEACDVVLGANRVGANFGSDFFISLSDGVDGSNQERFRITEAGNVGIGTASPGTKLTVSENAAGLASSITNSSSSGSGVQITAGNGTNNSLQIRNYAGGELMRVQGNGNVGIGSTAPGAKLEVDSGATNVTSIFKSSDNQAWISIQDDDSGTYGALIGTDTDAGNDFVIANQNAQKTFVINDGDVGIGTDSPSEKLHIEDSSGANIILNSNTGAANNGIYMTEGTSSVPTQVGAYVYYNGSTNKFNIATGVGVPTDKLTILRDSGDVGIGTTTPSEKLDVVGNIKIQSALLSNQENTDIDSAAAEVVAQVAHATYTAAFFDFVVKKGTNARSGTVYACHNGDTTPLVEFTETSTNDLGDTSDVTLSVDISGANMRLLATVTSDDWSVKSLIRAI